ncbi:unnamed protein product [Periconia digitata]|uniref:Uncharacterized protein n=1 Tax=Periconia digitata TaxID=1303443 RepID=A0A9W4U646_9PLEO|nr:unnamed protein product [Periconia digitata]
MHVGYATAMIVLIYLSHPNHLYYAAFIWARQSKSPKPYCTWPQSCSGNSPESSGGTYEEAAQLPG